MKRLIAIVTLVSIMAAAGKASAGPAQTGQAIAFATLDKGNLINFGGNGTKSASAAFVTTGIYNISFRGKYPKNVSPHTLTPIVSAWNNGSAEVADVRSITMDPNGFTVQLVLFSSGSELDIDGELSVVVFFGNQVN